MQQCHFLFPKFQPSSSAASTQTTKELTLNTPRKLKLKVEVRQFNIGCAHPEKQVETLIRQINEILSSVNHFYDICDVDLPPNLSLVVKSYVKMATRKPQD